MAKLIYSAITSLDGYVEDAEGNFDWGRPDDELFAFINDLERPIGTYLYGRRMYETMVPWETVATGADQATVARDFAAIWRGAEKVVYSRTLESASSAKTRIEREFDPEAVRQMKEAAGSDITIGGAELAGEAIRAGLAAPGRHGDMLVAWQDECSAPMQRVPRYRVVSAVPVSGARASMQDGLVSEEDRAT